MMGVGDEIAHSIEWIAGFMGKRLGDCKGCGSRRRLMNKWGPDGCEINRETILIWLRQGAHENNMPFNTKAADILLKCAIRKVRNEKTPPPVSQ